MNKKLFIFFFSIFLSLNFTFAQNDIYQNVSSGLDNATSTTISNTSTGGLVDTVRYVGLITAAAIITLVIFKLIEGAVLKGTYDNIYDQQKGNKILQNAVISFLIFIFVNLLFTYINPDYGSWIFNTSTEVIPSTNNGGNCTVQPIKLTNYGYLTDTSSDCNSIPDSTKCSDTQNKPKVPTGNHGNALQDGISAAVTKSLEDTCGLKYGDKFIAVTSQGTFNLVDADRAPENDYRIDVFRRSNGSNNWGGTVTSIQIVNTLQTSINNPSLASQNTPNCGNIPQSDLVQIGTTSGTGCLPAGPIYLQTSAANKFKLMQTAALASNPSVTITPTQGYRTDAQQTCIRQQQGCSNNSDSTCKNNTKVAIPCSQNGNGSNHESGTAVDISYGGISNCTNGVSSGCSKSPIYIWLKAHAIEYGFKQSSNIAQNDPVHWSLSGN